MRILLVLLGLVLSTTFGIPQMQQNPPPNMVGGFGPSPYSGSGQGGYNPGFGQSGPPIGNQQPGPAPRFAFHQDIDQLRALHGSSLNTASAQGSDTNRARVADSQIAQGSEGILSALRGKSRGGSSSKGGKFEHSATKGETWDDTRVWDESIETLDAAESQRLNAGVAEAEHLSEVQGSKDKLSATHVDAVDANREHAEGQVVQE